MITLNLSIYTGDVLIIQFDTIADLCEYISENIDIIISSVINGHFKLNDSKFYIQEYQSYEEAYQAALSMRETNSKAYK